MQRDPQKSKNAKRAKGDKAAPGLDRAMGRPPLPREVTRNGRIVTLVTKQEKANLGQLADATSSSISAVCHRLIAQGLERDMRTKPSQYNKGENQ